MKTQKVNSRVLSLAVASILAVGVGAFSVNSYAGTATDNLAVSASIAANCTISAAGTLAFDAYDPIVTHASTNLDQTGTVSTTCTTGSAVTVTLGQGANANTGSTDAVPLRQMASGANRLEYFLYSDSGRTTVFGNTGGTGKAETGTGGAVVTTVYGRVPFGQNKPVGDYADTVLATVTF